jgi:hypothetical protein
MFVNSSIIQWFSNKRVHLGCDNFTYKLAHRKQLGFISHSKFEKHNISCFGKANELIDSSTFNFEIKRLNNMVQRTKHKVHKLLP